MFVISVSCHSCQHLVYVAERFKTICIATSVGAHARHFKQCCCQDWGIVFHTDCTHLYMCLFIGSCFQVCVWGKLGPLTVQSNFSLSPPPRPYVLNSLEGAHWVPFMAIDHIWSPPLNCPLRPLLGFPLVWLAWTIVWGVVLYGGGGVRRNKNGASCRCQKWCQL
jgi:hypothetical protein